MKYSELTPEAQKVAMKSYNKTIPQEDQDPFDLEVYDFNADGTPEELEWKKIFGRVGVNERAKKILNASEVQKLKQINFTGRINELLTTCISVN
jgi:hypothetical protein